MDPRRLLPTLAIVAVVCVLATLVLTAVRHSSDVGRDPATDAEAPVTSSSATIRSDAPGMILAAWDEQRSTAWAHGDVAGLRVLYAPASRAGARDARLLQRYVDRGLRVTGLRMQVLSMRVVDRSPTRMRLLVTDRVVGGRAVGRGKPVTLPTDRASTRHIDLMRAKDQWVVAEVRDQASAAASTSRTSSSSKS